MPNPKRNKVRKLNIFNFASVELFDDSKNTDIADTNTTHEDKKSKKVSSQSTPDIFLEKTPSLPRPLPNENLQSSTGAIFLEKTPSLPKRNPNETVQSSPDDLALLDSTEILIRNLSKKGTSVYKTSTPNKNLQQIESGGQLNFSNNWPQGSPIISEDFNEKSNSVSIRPCFIGIQKIQPKKILKTKPMKVMSRSIKEMSPTRHRKAPMSSPFAEILLLSSTGAIPSEELVQRFSSCPICFKLWMLPDLQVHASGCQGEVVEEGFSGMAIWFLCGYCFLYIKEKEEDAEGHLLICREEQLVKRVKEEQMKRKKTLRGGPDIKSRFCTNNIDEEKPKHKKNIKVDGSNDKEVKFNVPLTSTPQRPHLLKTTITEIFKLPNGRDNITDECQPSTSKRYMNEADCKPSTSKRPRKNPNSYKNEERNFFLAYSSCPLCYKFWLIKDLEAHASECSGGLEEEIAGEEDILCGYCSMSVNGGERVKEKHLQLCQRKIKMNKRLEEVKGRKKTLRNSEK